MHLSGSRGNAVIALAAFVWMAAIAAGYQRVLAYSVTPGAAATPPCEWPANLRFQRNPDGPTLVMLAHPRCPCTRASLAELNEIMLRSPSARGYVFFLRPSDFQRAWAQSDTWVAASRIPRLTSIIDEEGIEAARFGAHTSGQVIVYDKAGKLVFSGGITPSRGHVGESAGETRIAALLAGKHADQPNSNVYGCALDDPDTRGGRGHVDRN